MVTAAAAADHSSGKKEEVPMVTCASVSSSDELISDTQGARSWREDGAHVQEKSQDLQDACPDMKSTATGFAATSTWKEILLSKKHLLAVLLVLATAVVPICILGEATTPPYAGRGWFNGLFSAKVVGCSGSIGGRPQNTTVAGIASVFALDTTFGAYTFAEVKLIDVAWDVGLGRGLQVLAAWAAYIVFCNALLKAIERQPTSFAVFQRIALEGPSIRSVLTLVRELWATKSRRTKALFFYILLSTAYILTLPIFVGAMTGYDTTSIAWANVDDTINVVPVPALKPSWNILGTLNETWSEPACADIELMGKASRIATSREIQCDCMLPNGTIYTREQAMQDRKTSTFKSVDVMKCNYDYPNNTKTFQDSNFIEPGKTGTYSCNSTLSMTIRNKTYDALDLKTEVGRCYNSIGYSNEWIASRTLCLPDVANLKYQWGFSTTLSGLFVFVTTAWVVSMYGLWLYSQHNSTLVHQGYRMTPLRAAFAMVRAAKQRTGLNEKGLVRKNTAELEKELYGGRGTKKAKLNFNIFVDDLEDGDDGLHARGHGGEPVRRRGGYELHPGREV